MKVNFKLSIALLAAIAAVAYFMFQSTGESAKPALTPAQKQIMAIGDKCLDYSERAIANDQATLEFQMVVRLSKKAGVIEQCMADNGYKTNPAWLKHAEPLAKTNAAKSKTSIEEVLTNLRRSDMQVFTPTNNRPDYWVKTK